MNVALERSAPICASSSSTSSISFLSTFVFVVYKSKAEALEHMKKRDTDHQSVSLENKTRDSTVPKIGDSAKVVIKQDMKGRRHKYGFNNNKREKPEKVRVVDDKNGDKHQLDEIMGSPPASPPPPPPPPPSPLAPSDASASSSAVKRTRKASRLRSLSTRPPGAERPVVHVNPATSKANGPHRKKLRTYLGIVARDKVDVTYENWKEAEFDIPEASDSRMKRKLLQTVGERWRQFKSDLTRNGPLQPIRTMSRTLSVRNTTLARKSGPSFARLAETLLGRMCARRHRPSRSRILPLLILSRGGYDYLEQKLLAEKTKKKLEEAAQSGSVDGVIDPPSPVRRHVKWKMARTKKTGEMTTEAAKEIAEKIDVLTTAIGRPEHPGRVRTAGAGVTIKQYFGSAPRTSRSSSSLPPKELQQLTQQIRDQLEESITEKVTQQLMASFSQMQSQGLAPPPDPLVGPSGPRVSTKGSCVDPSGNDPETDDSDRCSLYIEADPARLVAMGRVYEGSTVVHNTHLLSGQVKVSVEEVTDADAPMPVPTDEVSLVGQALHTFLAWPTHLDATVFGIFHPNFPLYIKHEDLSEIAHNGQCLSISVLQLWILHLTETCMRAGNSDIYGFLEPQSIQRSGQSQFEFESYIKTWMQRSKRDVYLGAYLNGGHWKMVVILPKEHLVVWFCSLHNRPDNYLKDIINIALKGLDDAPQPKSKAPARWIVVKCNRQKGSTECGYYVMHWMSTIILGTFRNNWEVTIGARGIKGITDLVGTVLSPKYLFVPVATYPSAGGRRVTRGMRVPRKEYARSRHQRLFEENVGKNRKRRDLRTFNKIGEVVAAQLAQASSARPGEQGCFLQKQPPSGGIFQRAQVGLGAICTPIFTKYTPLCCFLQKNVYTDNHSGVSAYHRARRLWMIQGCRMTKLGLCLSSGPPPLDDKRVRITIRMTKLGLCLSSGPPPLDDKRVRITIRYLRVSSGPPPLDDTRVQNDQTWSLLVIGPAASG
ncbi:hypothetical protein HKD37_02G004934 [Glycine soja]